jgi:hypothetical protein
MKTLIIILITFGGLSLARAQGTAPDNIKSEMQKLAYMAGKWKGEASMRQPNGTLIKVSQEEDIQYKLDGTILLIEGTGRNADGKVAFNALGIISYKPDMDSFGMKSHVQDGKQTEAYFKVLKENNFEWGFTIANNARIRYIITLNPQEKSWVEKGEYSPDGTAWYPFMEMNLTKQD